VPQRARFRPLDKNARLASRLFAQTSFSSNSSSVRCVDTRPSSSSVAQAALIAGQIPEAFVEERASGLESSTPIRDGVQPFVGQQ
jgi:hypothetical protein